MNLSPTRLLMSAALVLLANGCATVVPAPLVLARVSLATTSSDVAVLAPSSLSDAREALAKADREFAANGDTGLCRDYAYIAENKLELAESAARLEAARRVLDENSTQEQQGSAATAGPPTVAAH